MQNQDDFLRKYFRSLSRKEAIDPEDSELAYQLHHTRLNDPEIVDKLVKRCSEKLTLWVGILLYFNEKAYPTEEQIQSTLNQIFGIAVKNVDQFYGSVSVQDWLFSIAYKLAGEKNGGIWRKLPFYRIRLGVNHPSLSLNNEHDLEFLERLPNRQRSIIILRYLFDLSLQDISIILNQPVSKVHSQLKEIRKHQGIKSAGAHKEAEIESYADGLLDQDPDVLYQFTTHLSECGECQNYASQLFELENRFVEIVNSQWAFPSITENDQKAIVQQAKREIKQPKTWRKLELPIKQTAWLLGLFIIFIGLAVIFISMTPVEREFPSNIPIQPTQLPQNVEMQPARYPSKQTWNEAAASGLRDDDFSANRKCGKDAADERGSRIMSWTATNNIEYFLRKPLPHLVLDRMK